MEGNASNVKTKSLKDTKPAAITIPRTRECNYCGHISFDVHKKCRWTKSMSKQEIVDEHSLLV